MALNKTLIANGSNNARHRFTLSVNEDLTNGNDSIMSFNFTISPNQSGWDWYDWGDKISYEIKFTEDVLDKLTNKITTNELYKITGTIPQYNGSSTVVLKSANNIVIPHDTDGTKTINISFKVVDKTGQPYTCGDASENGQMELSVLHKGPELTSVAFEELNTLLTGIQSNQVVNDLSKVKLTLITTTYDNATVTNYSVKNGNYEVKGTTNVITMDFQSNKMVIIEEAGTNKCNYIIKLTDSLGASREFIVQQDVILYFKPNLIKTASSIKRNGQTSGKVNLKLAGTFYNNKVLSTQNSISLSYKYWKSNDTEPTTYYTIPTSAYTIKNNDISITKWNVAKNDKIITDVDKSSSYKFKIKATDSFGNISEIELICSKGEWLMAKFKDRVDFKKITINGKEVKTSIGKSCILSLSTEPSILQNTTTTILFDTFSGDTEYFKLNDNGIEILKSCKLLIFLQWTAWGNFSRYAYINKNKSLDISFSNGQSQTIITQAIVDCKAGDIIYGKCYSESDTAISKEKNQTNIQAVIIG